MLELKDIKKDYVTPSITTHALKGITLNFRRNEFVSILGPSGCGKTTLLNIIGGLDRYTEGDLIIEGKSTKQYKDRDWDTYRNHSIGFVFQSYNLIGHQTILGNVELALTIAGVKSKERKERAIAVLKKVGLENEIYKKPNQLSGGQMQRVAIARALINNPEILLADEPTGALDSETSIQIMDLLKEIASDRLVIMVTHNPDLANKYSTRIITLSDGLVTSDSNPFSDEEAALDIRETPAQNKGSKKRSSMSFGTSFMLSLRNLLSKKTRTLLMAFAGSIGIIGIALILGMSDGFNSYINTIQVNTLSQYPITINQSEVSTTSLITSALTGGGGSSSSEDKTSEDELGESSVFTSFFSELSASAVVNDLKSFKEYLESDTFAANYGKNVSAIQYVYDVDFQVYSEGETEGSYTKSYPVDYNSILADKINSSGVTSSLTTAMLSVMNSYSAFHEMINNTDLILSQYDVVAGSFPTSANEVVLVVDENNNIADYVLYALGLKDPEELNDVVDGKEVESWKGTYSDIINLSYKMPSSAMFYNKEEVVNAVSNSTGEVVKTYFTWVDKSQNIEQSVNAGTVTYELKSDKDDTFVNSQIDNSLEIKISGILRLKSDVSTGGALSTGINYTSALTEALINQTNSAPVVEAQIADPEKCVLLADFEYSLLESLQPSLTYDYVLSYLGVCDIENPSTIYIYPHSFDDKEQLVIMIDEYNASVDSTKDIKWTDTVGSLMDGISAIVDSVTIVLIAFVSVSLVVSSIMIAIITYVSVIERTKEIGVLRSLGASKNDISNVFNAETLIIGLTAGIFGVVISVILLVPINFIIGHFSGIYNIAYLAWYWALLLIGISVVLTIISGLVPSRIAAKRDPVVALRSGD